MTDLCGLPLLRCSSRSAVADPAPSYRRPTPKSPVVIVANERAVPTGLKAKETNVLIILEGPDLAGKTTLANKLLVRTAADYGRDTMLIHRGPPTSHPLDEYVRPLLSYRPNRDQHIVIDRWHLGEIVYPRILGRPTQMTPGIRRYVDAFLHSRGALLVHVDAPDDELITRYKQRGDDVRSLDQVLAAAREFRVVAKDNTLPAMHFTSVDDIVEAAYHREQTAHSSLLTHYYSTLVGAPYPITLYVGDTRGCYSGKRCTHSPTHHPLFPAFGPYPNTCGAFLMELLHDQYEIALCNINDVDSVYDQALHLASHIVALGRNASKTLRRMHITHMVVPHPQYVKRFHHRDADEYRRLLLLRDGKDYGSWRS